MSDAGAIPTRADIEQRLYNYIVNKWGLDPAKTFPSVTVIPTAVGLDATAWAAFALEINNLNWMLPLNAALRLQDMPKFKTIMDLVNEIARQLNI